MAGQGHAGAASNPRLLFSLIGIAEGVLWLGVDPFGLESAGADRLGIVLLFFASSTALVARFTWDGQSPRRWVGVAVALGVIAGAVTWRVWSQLPDAPVPYEGDRQRILAWLIGSFVFLYVSVSFAQSYQRSGVPAFPYTELFEHSWNNFFVGLVSLLFVAAFWTVLGVWGALFNVVGVSLFSDVFRSEPFAYVSTFAMFGYGLALGRANESVIRTLRRITLLIAHALLPVVALAAVLFVLTLPFTGIQPLWETRSATPLVLALLGLLTLSVNGVFEDGRQPPPYPKWLLSGLRAAVCTMPVFPAIALYGTSMRIRQYGLTPDRIYALLFIGVTSLYAVGYAVGALGRSSTWMSLLKPVNITTALVLAVLSILVQLPPLDPLRLSARSQLGRIRDQQVASEGFDFATLRFRLGHYGWAAMQELEEMTDHPEHERIREAVEIARAAETFWEVEQGKPASVGPVKFDVSPRDLRIPAGLLETISRGRKDLGTGMCARPGECLVLGVDLDEDGDLEYCFLGGPNWWYTTCYAIRAGSYEHLGSLVFQGEGAHPSIQTLERWLAAGPMTTRTPRYREVELEHGALHLVPGAAVSRD